MRFASFYKRLTSLTAFFGFYLDTKSNNTGSKNKRSRKCSGCCRMSTLNMLSFIEAWTSNNVCRRNIVEVIVSAEKVNRTRNFANRFIQIFICMGFLNRYDILWWRRTCAS